MYAELANQVHGTRGIGLPWSTPRKNMTNLYCTDHNLVIMHRDLRQLFYQNVFGIDVDVRVLFH